MKKTLRSLLFAVLMIFAASFLHAQTATQPDGSGESWDPYQISSLANLYWISQNSDQWNKHFVQTANIDASSTVNWNGGQGWEPIGNYDNNFIGTYDGQDHIIENLYINRQEQYQGLFGMVYASYARISNLGVVNVNITGGERYNGALAGLIYGNVDNCHSTGKVSGKNDVGGLFGHAMIVNISDSYSSARVYGDERVGGLAGTFRNGIIENSYSEGPVNYIDHGGDGKYIGGLVGSNTMDNSLIEDSYSVANVLGASYIGGFAGFNANRASIINCYSAGNVYGSGSSSGGLIGSSGVNEVVENSFWDTETSGQEESSGGDGVTGYTTDFMTTPDLYVSGGGWDF